MSRRIGDRAPDSKARSIVLKARGVWRSASSGAAACAALITLGGLLGARIASAVRLEVYGHLPQIEDVSISPDGTHIAFVRTDGDARIIWVGPLANPKTAFALKVGDQKLRGIINGEQVERILATTSIVK